LKTEYKSLFLEG